MGSDIRVAAVAGEKETHMLNMFNIKADKSMPGRNGER